MTLIVAAAIRWEGLIISVPRPGRHGEIINMTWRYLKDDFQEHQGFLTDDGRFLGRKEAFILAKENGQYRTNLGTGHYAYGSGPGAEERGILFSEDLWLDDPL